MLRSVTLAAAAVALFAWAAPAQAHVANPGLSAHLAKNSAKSSAVAAEPVHYRRYRHSHRSYRHQRRHRHCWNERVRVRVPGGYFVWRTHRRCGWRYW